MTRGWQRRTRDAADTVATPRRIADDEGSILPLIAVFTGLALALVLVVSAASSLYLERKRLLTLADGAALAAAEAFDLDATLVVDGRVTPVLHDDAVAAAVADYLGAAVDDGDSIVVDSAASPDGRSAAVTLSTRWAPPVVSAFVPGGLQIDVTSTARSVFG